VPVFLAAAAVTRHPRTPPARAEPDLTRRGAAEGAIVSQDTAEHPLPLTVLAEDERIFRDSVREFAEAQVRPLVREMDEHARIPRSLIDRLFELGVMGIEIPESYGGSGGTFFHSVLAVEELSRVDPSVGVLVDVQNTLVINALLRWGNDDVKRRYLPALAAGTVGAYALSEAGSGSDAFALTTRAREDGDTFVLSGRKLWITNGNEADLFLVFATIDPAAGYRGITAFLVERGFEGFSVGKKEDKLGIRASSTCELILEACRVPRANILGEPGKGYKSAIETLNEGRIGIGAQMIGLAKGALQHAIAYTKERKQFGKAIAEFQAVQHQLARAAVEVEAATLTVYNAARLREANRPFLTEAAICKIFSSEVAERVASLAVNLFGGNGFVKEYPVEKLYRDAKIGQIYEGTSNLQLQTIAKQLLG
jgi:alkylation response protein AidB-like acyl-CoA dehydrogenase